MQLIYCNNPTTSGTFKVQFDEDIVIPKGAKIGLLNAYMQFSDQVVIDSTNDRFQFKCADAHNYTTVFLDHATYDAKQLIEHIEKKLNEAVTVLGANNGCQFDVSEKDNEHVEIEFRKSIPTPLEIPVENNNSIKSIADNGWTSNSNSGTYSNYGFTDDHMNRGSAFLTCKIKIVGNFMIGLINEHKRPDTLAPEDFTIGIQYDTTTNTLYTLHEGDRVNTTLNLQVDDRLYLHHYDGQFHLVRYRGAGAAAVATMGTFTLSEYEMLFAYVAFKDLTPELINVMMAIDPFQTKDELGISKRTKSAFHDFKMYGEDYSDLFDPSSQIYPGNFTLSFELRPELGEVLGFDNTKYTYANVIGGVFDAEQRYLPERPPTSTIVTMPNIKLKAYSSLNRRSQNILMTILDAAVEPDANKRNRIQFAVDQPQMLSTDYERDITLRELEFRILRGLDNAEVTFHQAKSCQLTIIIDA